MIGVLGLILAFILVWNPLFAGMTIMFWIGIAIFAAGIFSIYLAFKLKKLNAMPKKISSELKTRYQTIKQELNDEIHKNN
jgi:phosphotransferase system  glucose/maltose/N-acetylglucosamine-specific IIC component